MGALAERRRAETRRDILAAAYRVFAEKGYAQATIDDVASAGGVSKGAIYHHFESKEELFRALLDDHQHEIEGMRAAIDRATSFSHLLRGVVGVWLEHYRSDPLFMPLSLELRVQATRASWARAFVADFYARIRALIAGILLAGQDAGLVRADLKVDDAATLLFGVLDGPCLQAAIDPGQVDLDAITEPMVDLIERYVSSNRKGDLRRLRSSLSRLLEHTMLGPSEKTGK
jgi:AcrR family transcriptional regulator